jgi:predicted ribosomally synthesized peptide with SipW-like signal peptide
MKKKSLALAAIAVLMVASLATALTLAYFTDRTQVETNVFSVGNVDITLTEPNWDKNKLVDGKMNIAPGMKIAKNPTVENTGDNKAYVRMVVTVDKAGAFTALLAHYGLTLDDVFIGHDENVWERASMDNSADTLTYVYNYSGILASKETATLFTDVTMPTQFTNTDIANLNGGFTITVKAEAIQADSFDNATDAFAALDTAA